MRVSLKEIWNKQINQTNQITYVNHICRKKKKTVDTSSDHHSSLQDEDGPAPLHYSNQKLDREPLRSEMIGSINQKQPFPVLRTEDALHHFARRGATPDRSEKAMPKTCSWLLTLLHLVQLPVWDHKCVAACLKSFHSSAFTCQACFEPVPYPIKKY